MSFFLRRHTVRNAARRRAGANALNETFTIASHVALTDHDLFGHMTNSRYAVFTALAVENVLLRTGLTGALETEPLSLRTVSERLLYHRMMQFPNRFVVRTQCLGWTDTRIGFHHAFLRGRKLTAESWSLHETVGRKSLAAALPTLPHAVDPIALTTDQFSPATE